MENNQENNKKSETLCEKNERPPHHKIITLYAVCLLCVAMLEITLTAPPTDKGRRLSLRTDVCA